MVLKECDQLIKTNTGKKSIYIGVNPINQKIILCDKEENGEYGHLYEVTRDKLEQEYCTREVWLSLNKIKRKCYLTIDLNTGRIYLGYEDGTDVFDPKNVPTKTFKLGSIYIYDTDKKEITYEGNLYSIKPMPLNVGTNWREEIIGERLYPGGPITPIC